MQAIRHASKEITLALKLKVNITRSPTQGYQWLLKNAMCPPKLFQNITSNPRQIGVNIVGLKNRF